MDPYMIHDGNHKSFSMTFFWSNIKKGHFEIASYHLNDILYWTCFKYIIKSLNINYKHQKHTRILLGRQSS